MAFQKVWLTYCGDGNHCYHKQYCFGKKCVELYKDVRISYPQTSYSYIENFSDEERKEVVECLAERVENTEGRKVRWGIKRKDTVE